MLFWKCSLRTRVWWPGLTKDAVTFTERCSVCWRKHINHAQVLQPSDIEGVWNKIAVDLVKIESTTRLSVVDYGSRYQEVIPLTFTTTAAVIGKLMKIFARFRLPKVIVSDMDLSLCSLEWNGFCLVSTFST